MDEIKQKSNKQTLIFFFNCSTKRLAIIVRLAKYSAYNQLKILKNLKNNYVKFSFWMNNGLVLLPVIEYLMFVPSSGFGCCWWRWWAFALQLFKMSRNQIITFLANTIQLQVPAILAEGRFDVF